MSDGTIEIDIDVHKAIEAARLSFDDTPNDILRRLLGIEAATRGSLAELLMNGSGWSYGGVFLPNGSRLGMTYNGEHYTAIIQDGALRIGDIEFKSLSGAAQHVTGQNLNGWNYWHVQRPGEAQYILTNDLRTQRSTRQGPA